MLWARKRRTSPRESRYSQLRHWADSEFYAQSFTVFYSLQEIAASQQRNETGIYAGSGMNAGPSVQAMQYYHRIGSLYCDELHQFFTELEVGARGLLH